MSKKGKSRRVYDEDFKAEAVRMLLDGHSAGSVASRLGVSCPTTIRRWKQQHLEAAGPVADVMACRVKDPEVNRARQSSGCSIKEKKFVVCVQAEFSAKSRKHKPAYSASTANQCRPQLSRQFSTHRDCPAKKTPPRPDDLGSFNEATTI